jgi:hypothetical protein
MLLEKKTAVIYGAGGAIGGAVARAYASEGAKVFVTGRLRAPVEALDLGTGYEVAAAAIRGLTRRLTTGEGSVVHMSLARTAAILTDKGEVPEQGPVIELLDGENLDGPWEDRVYSSGRGPVRRLPASGWISSETRSIGTIPWKARALPTPSG